MTIKTVSKTRRNSCLLVLTAFIWGIAFVAVGNLSGISGRELVGCVLIFLAVILAQLYLWFGE